MAATVDSSVVYIHGGMIEQHVSLSSLVSDATETITVQTGLGAPNKVAPLDVNFEVTAAATSGDQVTAEHIVASDSTSGNTVAIKARVGPAGDITGAKLKVKIRWLDVARQDGQSINSANNT